MKISCKKPTGSDVMLHQAMNFGKNYGIEPVTQSTYVRTMKLSNHSKLDSQMEKSVAPWDPDQVRRLHLRQLEPLMHGYTCPKGSNLTPTENGWICSCCDYTQDWAHKSDVEYTYPQLGLKPIDRMYMAAENQKFRDAVWKLINMPETSHNEQMNIQVVLERLAVYEPHLRGLFPWETKKEA